MTLWLVNKHQSPATRRAKYRYIREAGFDFIKARRMRDWTWSHIRKFIEYNKRVATPVIL